MMGLFASARILLHKYGYLAVFGAIFLEDFGIPVPGETLLIAASLSASQGDLHILPLVFVAWVAAVIGDNIGYVIGRYGGRRFIMKYGRYVFLTTERMGHADAFFRRHGDVVVVVARFFEILRQLNGIVAGAARMPWWRFLLFNAVGAALWIGFWTSLAFFAGQRVHEITALFKRYEVFFVLFLLGIAFAIGFIVVRRKRKNKML